MTEYLFKLKKDGKTVGYLKLAKGWTQFHSLNFAEGQWYYPCNFKWTSAHPFVTKDKHGKDVFAGDCCYSGNAEGYIRWSNTELAWMYEWDDKRGDTHSVPVSKVSIIELIEDKKDD